MKWIKAVLIAMTLALSFNANALTDVDEMIFKNAVNDGDLKVTKKYIEADKNLVNEKFFGWAPLQMATNTNQMKTVEYLISKGAEIDYVQPNAKHTAFHLAALNGFTEMCTLLAEKGADVNIKLYGGVSLIQLIKK